jgi:RNA polymerase sigma-70 factor (ECF subfamily)
MWCQRAEDCPANAWGYPTGVHGDDHGETLSIEESWLRAAASGDRVALGSLYDRFAPAMLAVAQRVLGSPREAEDLVHDVFLEAWHRARHYDRQRGTVQTWLMLRLRSRALDRLRAGQRRARLIKEAIAEEPPPPSSNEIESGASEQAHALHGFLAELNHDQRQVLELAYFEGLPLAEIAVRLTLPIGTVKSRMSRAIGELRLRVERGDGRHG